MIPIPGKKNSELFPELTARLIKEQQDRLVNLQVRTYVRINYTSQFVHPSSEHIWTQVNRTDLHNVLKGQSDEIFLLQFFIKRLTLVPMDIPRSDCEFRSIFMFSPQSLTAGSQKIEP